MDISKIISQYNMDHGASLSKNLQLFPGEVHLRKTLLIILKHALMLESLRLERVYPWLCHSRQAICLYFVRLPFIGLLLSHAELLAL